MADTERHPIAASILRPACDLVLVHQVSHAGIDAFGHGGAHAREDVGTLVHARLRDVRVDVAAAEEHRRARELPASSQVVPGGPIRPPLYMMMPP